MVVSEHMLTPTCLPIANNQLAEHASARREGSIAIVSNNEGRLFDRIVAGLQESVFGASVKKWNRKRYSGRTITLLSDAKRTRDAVQLVRNECREFLVKNHALAGSAPRGLLFGALRKVLAPARKREEVLERLLAAADDRLFNRFNFLSGITPDDMDATTRSMTVDLIRLARPRRDRNAPGTVTDIREFVELKEETNRQDSPVSALFEALMYLSLYQCLIEKYPQLPRLTRDFHLVVLAPEPYYKYWQFARTDEDVVRMRQAFDDVLKTTYAVGGVSFRQLRLTKDQVNRAQESLRVIRDGIPPK